MALVEIPLNSYQYRFRSLTWEEEAQLPVSRDSVRVLLSAALHDVSGRLVSHTDAKVILAKIPDVVVLRVWQQYKVALPENRYYSSSDLYRAPEAATYQRQMVDEQDERDQVAEQAHVKLSREDSEVSKAMLDNARKAGTLMPATEQAYG